MEAALLEARNITKIYPNGVAANRNVNFSVQEGEIHALAGENGAGKSTLMKILFGMEQPSEGELRLRGQRLVFASPLEAIAHGIGMVHQHFMLVPSFTVAQNIILGTEPRQGLKIDYAEAMKKTREISIKYNLTVDLEQKVENLSVGMKQKVEILKALYRNAQLLILDEPTAVLTPQETAEFFVQLRKLKEAGMTIIFISHKLKEVKEICDRITIMRGGQDMGVYPVAEMSEQDISRRMVGRDVVLKYDKPPVAASADSVLAVRDLCCQDARGKKLLSDVNLAVRGGEILGVAGVDGNGQTQLVKAIMGELPVYGGRIEIGGRSVAGIGVKGVRGLGTAYIPEDRISEGTAGEASIADNLIAGCYFRTEAGNGWLLSVPKITKLARKWIEDFHILCSGESQKVQMLSGGNMQKVVVARECSAEPRLLIAEQPTRGVDVGSAQFIHQNILRLRQENTAILLISADLNEVMELSDRLIVMYNGEVAAYFADPSQVSEEELGLAMLGLQKQPAEEIRRAFYETSV